MKKIIIGVFLGTLIFSLCSINIISSSEGNLKMDISLTSLKTALADDSEICSVSTCYQYQCGGWGTYGCALSATGTTKCSTLYAC